MSVRRRGDKWVAQVYDPKKQRKVWVGTFEDKEDAKDAELQAWKDLRRGRNLHKTVDGFAANWIELHPRRRESTNKHYAERVKKVADSFAGRRLNDVDRVEARAWAVKHRSLFPIARAMFSDAVRDGLLAENPFTGLRLEQSRGRMDLVVPTEEELSELVLSASGLHGAYGKRVLGPFIQFGAWSGLRPGELYGLRWDDLDFGAHTLRVERQFNAKTRTFTEPKTRNSRRTIYLTPQAAEAAKQIPHIREEVFSAPRGGILSGTTMSGYWQPVARSVGRPDFTPHCLRHFYGTQLALRGLGAPEIARELGHDDGGALALKRYIHLTGRDVHSRVAAAFGGNVQNLRAVEGE